jgi:hypothetical protein
VVKPSRQNWGSIAKRQEMIFPKPLILLVGAGRFELPTPSPPEFVSI